MLNLIVALLLSVLSVRFAYAEPPILARIELSQQAGASGVYTTVLSATAEFELPTSGEFSGEGNTVWEFSFVQGGPVAECRANVPTNIRFKVSGRREGQQIKFNISHSGKFSLVITCPNGYGPPVDIPFESSPGLSLYVADKATVELPHFQRGPLYHNGSITLRLACPVTVQRPSTLIGMSPEQGQDPWPLVLDNSQTSEQIKAKKRLNVR